MRSSPALRRVRRRTAIGLLLALFASSCSSLDIKPTVSVGKLPLDLKFGAKTRDDTPPPPVPPPPIPEINIPNIKPPPPPPPPPPETCVFTEASERKALNSTIKPEDRSNLFGSTHYWRVQQWTHDAKAPDEDWVFGDPEDISVRPGAPPNDVVRVDFVNVPSAEPPGYWMVQNEGKLGMRWRFQVAFGDDPGTQNPNIGFFLHGLGIPPEYGAAPDMDDAVSASLSQGSVDGMVQPFPRLKLFSFPVPIGQSFSASGYDPFNRTAFSSQTFVVEDERVRECNEHVRAWKVDWKLQMHGNFEHEILGSFWFATQFGGMIVKADYCMGAPGETADGLPSSTDPCSDPSVNTGGPLMSGFVRHNIHNLDPIQG